MNNFECSLNTPRDERVLSFSPVSNWGDVGTVDITEVEQDKIVRRIDSLETLMREMHLSTRKHVAKGLREVVSIEKGHILRLVKESKR